ncbi:MAG: phosphoserine phosphatase SerB [bacterium]
MDNKKYIVLTAFGKNQPYLIADICAVVTDSKLNIVAVEQNALHGLFILFMVTEPVSSDDPALQAHKRLQVNAQKLPLDVNVDLVEAATALKSVEKSLQVFTIIGRDKVGILKAITNTLANFRVNIERMHHLARGELVALEMLVDASELRDLAILKDVIQRTCDDVGFDTIIQPDSPHRQRRRLVVFDMDNTLIEGEIIDELAKCANVGEKVSALTQRAMAGEIEFAEALKQRVKLLKGLPVSVLEEVALGMQLTAGAFDLVSTLKAMGFKLALISGGFTFFANRMKEKLSLDYAFANDLEIENDVLTGKVKGRIIDRETKGKIVKELAEREGISREEIVAVGDGANDEIMLRNSGLGIAFNASELLQKVADGSLTNANLLGLLYCLGATDRAIPTSQTSDKSK